MNKIYSLIHLNGESYMVDKEYQEDSLVIYGTGLYRVRSRNMYHPINGEWICMPNQDAAILPYDRVLATTDKKLSLPLLPPIEEDIDKLAVEWDRKATGYDSWRNELRDAFKQGYKANKKKWTDEDMRKAWNHTGLLDMGKGNIKKITFEEFLKSLKPKPIAVEVEMEDIPEKYYQNQEHRHLHKTAGFANPDNFLKMRPKVDQNNFVIVKRWIYER